MTIANVAWLGTRSKTPEGRKAYAAGLAAALDLVADSDVMAAISATAALGTSPETGERDQRNVVGFLPALSKVAQSRDAVAASHMAALGAGAAVLKDRMAYADAVYLAIPWLLQFGTAANVGNVVALGASLPRGLRQPRYAAALQPALARVALSDASAIANMAALAHTDAEQVTAYVQGLFPGLGAVVRSDNASMIGGMASLGAVADSWSATHYATALAPGLDTVARSDNVIAIGSMAQLGARVGAGVAVVQEYARRLQVALPVIASSGSSEAIAAMWALGRLSFDAAVQQAYNAAFLSPQCSLWSNKAKRPRESSSGPAGSAARTRINGAPSERRNPSAGRGAR